jgi:hypothetical protein
MISYGLLWLLTFVSFLNGNAQLKIKAPKGYNIKDSTLAADIRIAVMTTGHFDHSSFSKPKWVTSKWSNKLWRNKEGELCRKRKVVIVITYPEDIDYSIIYFWVIQKKYQEDKKWYINGIDIIWQK